MFLTRTPHVRPLDAMLVVQWLPFVCALALLLRMLFRVLYNLFFHPLAKFPGPRLAAASTWWKTWLEIVEGRSISLELVKIHAKYGDIVRIGPNELHFGRSTAYHEIYNSANRWTKDMSLYHTFADERCIISTPDYDDARRIREVVGPIFSRRNMIQMQGLVQQYITQVCLNIDSHIKEGRPFDLFYAFRSYALDVVFTVCFAIPLNTTSHATFGSPLLRSIQASTPGIIIFKHFPLVKRLMGRLPRALAVYLAPHMEGFLDMRQILNNQVKDVVSNPHILAGYAYRTIYHELMKDEKSIPSEAELRDEALEFVSAGTQPPGDALFQGVIRVIMDQHICKKLQRELDTAWPVLDDFPCLEELEKLPYLNAVILESLRFSHGAVHPMTRIVPTGGAVILDEYIPAGTIVGISNIFVHCDENIFPEHLTFNPERWLASDARSRERWMVAFSKGPRSCPGINLAWCELYMGFSCFFRRYTARLNGNIRNETLTWRDCYLPYYKHPEVDVTLEPRAL